MLGGILIHKNYTESLNYSLKFQKRETQLPNGTRKIYKVGHGSEAPSN